MVYCTKCGTKNPDDAEVCSQCGAALYPGAPPTRRSERRKEGGECFGRREEEECFGIPRGGTVVGLAIGAIIVIWGAITLLQQPGIDVIPRDMSPWPFAVIILGILIVIGALYGLSRRY